MTLPAGSDRVRLSFRTNHDATLTLLGSRRAVRRAARPLLEAGWSLAPSDAISPPGRFTAEPLDPLAESA
jgi:hypothetical protein